MLNTPFGSAQFDPDANWFFYGRVSSEEQKKQKTIESQIEDARRLLPNLPEDRIFKDEAVSGSVPFLCRLGSSDLFAQMRKEFKAGRKPCLFVQFVDRLGRDAEDTIGTWNRLKLLKVKMVSPYEGLFEGDEADFRIGIFAVMAQYVKRRILAGTAVGMRRKVEEGKFITGGRTPFGYCVVDDEKDSRGKRRRGRFVVKESEAEIIRDLYERAAAGETGPRLAEYLNRMGVVTPEQNLKGKWTRQSVRSYLGKSMYKGVWPYGKRRRVTEVDQNGNTTAHLRKWNKVPKELQQQPVERTCPPIVSEDLWQRANDAIESHGLAMQARHEYLLAGIIKCGVCGKVYGGRGYAYACRWRHVCGGQIMHRKPLEDSVWDLCRLYIEYPGEALKQLEHQMAAEAKPERKLDEERRKLETRLAQINKAWDDARRKHHLDPTRDDEYKRDAAYYDGLLAEVRGRLSEIETADEFRWNKARALGEVKTLLEQLRSRVAGDDFTFEQKYAIVRALVAKITIIEPPANAEEPGVEHSDLADVTFRFSIPHLFERARRERFPAGKYSKLEPESDDLGAAAALRVVLNATG